MPSRCHGFPLDLRGLKKGGFMIGLIIGLGLFQGVITANEKIEKAFRESSERQEYRQILTDYGVRYQMEDIAKFPKEIERNYKRPTLGSVR